MSIAYFNYPTGSITIHRDQGCGHIQPRSKDGQRAISIGIGNLSRELAKFQNKEHDFSATAKINDMWVEVDSGDAGFDRAVTEFIRNTLGKRYKPFKEASTFQCRCTKT